MDRHDAGKGDRDLRLETAQISPDRRLRKTTSQTSTSAQRAASCCQRAAIDAGSSDTEEKTLV